MPSNEANTRLAVFISGRGSNMKSLVEACYRGDVDAWPSLVVSNNYHASGLEWASEQGIAIAAIDHRAYGKERAAFEAEIQSALNTHEIDFIALAGFMRVLTEDFVRAWSGRMINIHPSLLPKYKGLHTHRRALEAGDNEHGCSVHWVSEGVDEGEVIDREIISIVEGDTEETLAQKVLEREHVLYPRALQLALASLPDDDTSNLNDQLT